MDSDTIPQGRSILLAMSWYDHRTHLGISRFAKRHGWRVDARMANSTEMAWGWKGDGVITKIGCSGIDEDLHRFIEQLDCPIVDLSMFGPSLGYNALEFDPDQIGEMATGHFIERGFAHFAWFPDVDAMPIMMRGAGFAGAVEALTGQTTHMIAPPSGESRAGRDWAEDEARLGADLAALPRPLAVMCFNDEWGARVIRACQAAGLRIPEDVAVLGVDDNQLVCEHQPVTLSSVRLDLEHWGMVAAQKLGLMMADGEMPDSPTIEHLPPSGISVRQSTDVISVDHADVLRAAKYIVEHHHEQISAADVIGHGRLSGSGLKQAFRKHLGRSIGDEIRRVRYEHTRRLLTETDWTLDRVAQAVGLGDTRGLHRLFAHYHDETPTEYRKRHAASS